jgi:hypothetical protein
MTDTTGWDAELRLGQDTIMRAMLKSGATLSEISIAVGISISVVKERASHLSKSNADV